MNRPLTEKHDRSTIRCCGYLFDKLEFSGQWPLTMRARCSDFRYCPDPLGIVTAKQLDKLEFVKLFLSEKTYNSFRPMDK